MAAKSAYSARLGRMSSVIISALLSRFWSDQGLGGTQSRLVLNSYADSWMDSSSPLVYDSRHENSCLEEEIILECVSIFGRIVITSLEIILPLAQMHLPRHNQEQQPGQQRMRPEWSTSGKWWDARSLAFHLGQLLFCGETKLWPKIRLARGSAENLQVDSHSDSRLEEERLCECLELDIDGNILNSVDKISPPHQTSSNLPLCCRENCPCWHRYFHRISRDCAGII